MATNPWTPNNTTAHRGDIHRVLNNKLMLKFAPAFHEKYNGEDWKLEFHFSRMKLRKEHHAINKAVHHLGGDFLFPSVTIKKPPQLDVHIDDDGLLINGQRHIPWINSKLNDVQKIAVLNVLRGEACPMPYIIFGPPGTGKTITTIEAILQICRQLPDSRILVGTPSNSAANLLCERIAQSGALKDCDFVRLVGYNAIESGKIPEHILQYCATCDIAREGTVKDDMKVLDSGLKLRCNVSVLGRHRITIGTCNTLGTLMQMAFPRDHFTHVVIDESGQCLETEALIPITFLNKFNGQVILAGDPMQLGPVVLSRFAVDRGLNRSILVRLLDRVVYQKDHEVFCIFFFN